MRSKLKSAKIGQFALIVLLCFGTSVEAGNYECQKCQRQVDECWGRQKNMRNSVTSMQMIHTCSDFDKTCERICNGGSTNTPSFGPSSFGSYCCDLWGNAYCIVASNFIGSTCLCQGQGYGVICR